MKAREYKNTKTNSDSVRISLLRRLNFVVQENIDFKALFRYKKASTEREKACQGDSVEALSKENRWALLELREIVTNKMNTGQIVKQNGSASILIKKKEWS